MKIIADGKGKYIVDFEGLKVDVTDLVGSPVSGLFNEDHVSVVQNGVFFVKPKEESG